MEEEDNGGRLEVGEKPSPIQPPSPRPRPVPRPRNQTKGLSSTEMNGKPVITAPKPMLPPKPRRPPPNAPATKPPVTNPGVLSNNNDDEFPVDEGGSTKQHSVTEKSKDKLSSTNIMTSADITNSAEMEHVKNGSEKVDSTDEQWYQPLRPQPDSDESSSDDGYEKLPTTECSEESKATASRRDDLSGSVGKSSPPVPGKVSNWDRKISPPVQRKISDLINKMSPHLPHKSSGVASAISPQHPSQKADEENTKNRRNLESSTAGEKSKPLPPKKPLPSFPKGMSTPGQKPLMGELSSSKPTSQQKPYLDLSSSPKTDQSQTSVAALAQKLSTIPLFPFRDDTGSKTGGAAFPSPVTSPLSSPRPSPRNATSSASPDKSKFKSATVMAKVSEVGKPVLSPRPGTSLPKSQSQVISPEHGKELKKNRPERPTPPSAKAVARVRSQTLENLEEEENYPSDEAVNKTPGRARKSSLPEQRKKRLASRPLSRCVNPRISSADLAQASRRPPPLPPGATPITEKPPSLKVPPLPAVPRPRPMSAYQQTARDALKHTVSKSVSVGDIPRVTSAEDQSEYCYAYNLTSVGGMPPRQAVSPNPASFVVDSGTYVTPDESIVNEFMQDVSKESICATYEVADEQAVAGLMTSLKKKQTLNGLAADVSTDDTESDLSDSDDHEYLEPPIEQGEEQPDHHDEDDDDASSENSFSSDSSHEYCVPPENLRPPEPPSDGDEYDELEGIYVEPPVKSPSDPFSSDEERDGLSEEPLYQVYNRRTLRRERNLSRRRLSSDVSDLSVNDEVEELTKGTMRNMRMLWCELPEVKASGILDGMKSEERKRQEAMFEVITSEASYLKSLNILRSHFINSEELSSGSSLCVLERGQSHVLFSNISSIKAVSESFLQALRARQKEAVVISSISDIIEEHATKYFEVYVKYCSNQIYQDRALKNLKKNVKFLEVVSKLQSSNQAQGLTLQSFLVLPMQRITRLPLLVNAICTRCEPGSDEFVKSDRALAAINKIVNDCNEGARKMERMEEICVLQTQIEFKTKPLALATPSRYLLRRGDLLQVVEDSKSPLKLLRPKFRPIYVFLFNDLLLLAKKKSDNRYLIQDYATRTMTQVDDPPQDCNINVDHMFSLVLLENSEVKTKEFLLAGNTETDKTRWMEAFKPPVAEQEGETVYADWDCPQVNALHNYTAQQPDELSLYEGDVINVLKKLPDGWYHGERLCDGTQGWFPANHTEEILNDHVRARNLRQRYRLLAASQHLIGGTLRT